MAQDIQLRERGHSWEFIDLIQGNKRAVPPRIAIPAGVRWDPALGLNAHNLNVAIAQLELLQQQQWRAAYPLLIQQQQQQVRQQQQAQAARWLRWEQYPQFRHNTDD